MKQNFDKKNKFLESVAKSYDITNKKNEFDYYYRKFHFIEISKKLNGNEILELGCSTGLSTNFLNSLDINITVVEGSEFNILKTKDNFDLDSKVKFHHSLWENFNTKEKFTDILFVDSIQFIKDRKSILKKYKKYLVDDGLLHIIIPNSNSLHRQIGLEMGIIDSLTDQSDIDKSVNSKQDLDWELSRELFRSVHLDIINEIPILLKPFDNKTMLSLSKEQIEAYFNIAHKFKNICSHMYFVLKDV